MSASAQPDHQNNQADTIEKLSDMVKAVFVLIERQPVISEHDAVVERLKATIETCTREAISLVISRKAMTDICEAIFCLPPAKSKVLAKIVLEKLHARVISFEDQIVFIRSQLTSIYESEGDYQEAAQVLIGIPLLTGQKEYSTHFKMVNYLKITDLFLKAGDIDKAENYINRASLLQTDDLEEELKLRYKVAYAKILDHKRKFIEAAQRYGELASKGNLPEFSQNEALSSAILCTILANAGVRRSRMLATLFKDERSLSFALYGMLEKLHHEKLIKRTDLEVVDSLMQPHHKALTPDGLTLLERAIVEHNLIAASKLYKNVAFEQLGALLQIDGRKAEKIAATMIGEDRMAGTIDQISNSIDFRVADYVASYNQHIGGLCQQVNVAIDGVAALYKDWAVQNS